MAEKASAWTEKAKALGVSDDDIVRIRKSKIDLKELEDDTGTTSAVPLSQFKEILEQVKRSAAEGVAEASKKPEAPAAPTKAAAPAADGFFEEEIGELTTGVKVLVARSEKNDLTSAKTLEALCGLVERIATGLSALADQVATSNASTQGELVKIQASMAKPGAPRSLGASGRVAAAPAPGDEQPSVIVERVKFNGALQLEIKRSQAAIQVAPDNAARAAGMQRMTQLQEASRALTVHQGGDFSELYAAYNIPTPAAAAA